MNNSVFNWQGQIKVGGAEVSLGEGTRLLCPECRTDKMSVQQTISGPAKVIRARKCANGHRFYTVETVTTADEYSEANRAQIQRRRGASKH